MINLTKLAKSVALGALLGAAIALPLKAKELTIALDVSGSNPLLIDEAFNRMAAGYVAEHIQALDKGDTVVLQTFGDLREPQNFKRYAFAIKRHNGKKVAAQIAQFIKAAPSKLDAQGSTNLIAWLGRGQFGCERNSHVIVLTDGIEASEYANPNKLLSGEQALPKPNEFVSLAGCTVTFYGLGVGRLDSEVLTLRRAWSAYFAQAEAQFFAVVK